MIFLHVVSVIYNQCFSKGSVCFPVTDYIGVGHVMDLGIVDVFLHQPRIRLSWGGDVFRKMRVDKNLVKRDAFPLECL